MWIWNWMTFLRIHNAFLCYTFDMILLIGLISVYVLFWHELVIPSELFFHLVPFLLFVKIYQDFYIYSCQSSTIETNVGWLFSRFCVRTEVGFFICDTEHRKIMDVKWITLDRLAICWLAIFTNKQKKRWNFFGILDISTFRAQMSTLINGVIIWSDHLCVCSIMIYNVFHPPLTVYNTDNFKFFLLN